MKKFCLFICLIQMYGLANAKTIKVPQDQAKVEDAIEMASNGDTILVSPGRYFEDINFRNKNLMLTSYFLFDHDTSYIRNTIIDGSIPTHPDSASCIIIADHQDSSTVVQGFTITGGQGTSWADENSDGTYREGGGILVAVSSPIIRNNLIINNFATNKVGLFGAGGGGIRCGDGNAKILNNAIINNEGRYGGAMVFNYCSAIIRNNLIAFNRGGEDYGSGGIWINGQGPDGEPNIIENNTIVNNHSATDGGGVLLYNGNVKAIMQNNIIYGNTEPPYPQISLRGANVPVTYCNIQGGWTGEGNIDSLPGFTDSLFYLNTLSPCIDAGNPDNDLNDYVDPVTPDSAIFPSLGTKRNDMGAYGGKNRSLFPYFRFSSIGVNKLLVSFGNNNLPEVPVTKKITIINQSNDTRQILSVTLNGDDNNLQLTHSPSTIFQPAQPDSIIIEWTPTVETSLNDTLLIYHNTLNSVNPLKIAISGKVKPTSSLLNEKSKKKINLFPNPVKDCVSFEIKDNKFTQCFIYNFTGQKVTDTPIYFGINKLNISALSKGIYFIHFASVNEVITQKLVVN